MIVALRGSAWEVLAQFWQQNSPRVTFYGPGLRAEGRSESQAPSVAFRTEIRSRSWGTRSGCRVRQGPTRHRAGGHREADIPDWVRARPKKPNEVAHSAKFHLRAHRRGDRSARADDEPAHIREREPADRTQRPEEPRPARRNNQGAQCCGNCSKSPLHMDNPRKWSGRHFPQFAGPASHPAGLPGPQHSPIRAVEGDSRTEAPATPATHGLAPAASTVCDALRMGSPPPADGSRRGARWFPTRSYGASWPRSSQPVGPIGWSWRGHTTGQLCRRRGEGSTRTING